MKNLACCLLLWLPGLVLAEPFTYQGKLDDGNMPANGPYDLQFTLLSGPDPQTAIPIAGPVTLEDVPVSNGVFTVNIDFGYAFDGNPSWLDIQVRPGNSTGDFTRLLPTQAVTTTPVAQIALQSVNDETGADWALNGNALGSGQFLGSTNTQPVEIRVNNQPVLRLLDGSAGTVHAPNVLAGASSNTIPATNSQGDPVVGATIAGGGGNPTAQLCGSGSQTCVNQAGSSYATVGGGSSNIADADLSTISGGSSNYVWGYAASIGGGASNKALGATSVIGGGSNNITSGLNGTIGGGESNTAAGDYATVPGGLNNHAGGNYSFAAGRNAQVRDAATAGNTTGDEGSFVWADSQPYTFTTSGKNQFLVRAGGGMGIGTNAPESPLHLMASASTLGSGSYYVARIENLYSGNYGASGGLLLSTAYTQQDAYFTHLAFADASTVIGTIGNNRLTDGLRLTSDNFVMDVGAVGIGIREPENRLHVYGFFSGSQLSTHVMQIENGGIGTNADALAIVLGTSTPGPGNNYISFYHSGGTSLHGAIESTAGGGLTFTGTSADIAEYLPAERVFEPGTVVGLYRGRLIADTRQAEKVLVVSSNPIIVGNNDMQGNRGKALVALLGQVPVQVEGPVRAGDWLVASGNGKARALNRADWADVDLRLLVGKALTGNVSGQVTALVGLPPQELLAAQQRQLRKQAQMLRSLQRQMADLQRVQQQLLAHLQSMPQPPTDTTTHRPAR